MFYTIRYYSSRIFYLFPGGLYLAELENYKLGQNEQKDELLCIKGLIFRKSPFDMYPHDW